MSQSHYLYCPTTNRAFDFGGCYGLLRVLDQLHDWPDAPSSGFSATGVSPDGTLDPIYRLSLDKLCEGLWLWIDDDAGYRDALIARVRAWAGDSPIYLVELETLCDHLYATRRRKTAFDPLPVTDTRFQADWSRS